MIVFTVLLRDISNFIYGGNSVMAAYETVDLMARVRFPLTALKLNKLFCKFQAKVLRTERLAAKLLAIAYSGLLFGRWNSICPEGTQMRTKQIKTFINKNLRRY